MKIGSGLGRAAAVAVGIWAVGAVAADVKAPLPEETMNLAAVQTVMNDAAFKTEIDSDGDLKITDGGLIAFFKVDTERKLITIFAIYRLKASATELQRLQLINRLNDKVIVVRFCVPNERTLWCDYQFGYEGGISPFYILSTYRQFARVVRAAVATHDTEDIVGSDE